MADGDDGFVSTTGTTVKNEANATVAKVTHSAGEKISNVMDGLMTAGLIAGAATVDTLAVAHGLPPVATAAVTGNAVAGSGKKTMIS